MINEYALDPALLTTWDTVRFYLDKFGINQGRLLAQYPSAREWARAVRSAFPTSPPAERVMEVKRVEARLEQLIKAKTAFAAGRGLVRWNQMLPWLPNAESEHLREPFHAIVTGKNGTNRPHLIVGDDINEDVPPTLWQVERSRPEKRQGPEMARALAPLFRLARTVVFVDRNFDPLDSGYQAALTTFLQRLWECCCDRSNLRVEYHTGNDDRPHEKNPRRLHTATEFVRLCSANLSPLIPSGMRIKFVRSPYRKLHDRYVLTDRAAVQFGQGLDEASANEAIQTVELTLLDDAASVRHYQAFAGSTPHYIPDPASTVEVVGTKTV